MLDVSVHEYTSKRKCTRKHLLSATARLNGRDPSKDTRPSSNTALAEHVVGQHTRRHVRSYGHMNVRGPGMQVLKNIRQCVRVYLCTIVHALWRLHMNRSLRMYAGTYARPGSDCIEALPTRHGDCRTWCFVAELHVAAE